MKAGHKGGRLGQGDCNGEGRDGGVQAAGRWVMRGEARGRCGEYARLARDGESESREAQCSGAYIGGRSVGREECVMTRRETREEEGTRGVLGTRRRYTTHPPRAHRVVWQHHPARSSQALALSHAALLSGQGVQQQRENVIDRQTQNES